MQSNAQTVDEYINQLPAERKEYFTQLRQTILKYLPKGFSEEMGYGMIGYCVPHSIYPAGYHCNSQQPLPFAGLASQKNSINFYHMGIYSNTELLKWFVDEYPKHCKTRLDMGKSCIRFKKLDQIPLQLIGELMQKISVNDWITQYENTLKK